MEHVKELLSPYVDGALSSAESGRVDAHIAACAACREELAELKKVSRLVGSLPLKELPPGFMARLQSRRREDEAPRALPWFPAPMRLAAFAAAGVLVVVVAYEKAGKMNAPLTQGIANLDMEAEPQAMAQRRGTLKDNRTQGGLGAGAPSKEEEYTNEKLQEFLLDERKKLGIRQIVPSPSADRPPAAGAVPDRPLSPEEAREAMKNMTSELQEMNQQRQAMRPPVVPLGEGSSPKLLSRKEDSKPIDADAADAAPSADTAGKKGAPESSIALASKDGSLRFGSALSASSPGAGPVGSLDALTKKKAAGARGAAAPAKAPAAPAAKPEAAPRQEGWTGSSSRLKGPGGAVIQTATHWVDLWSRMERAGDPPLIDFGRSMAVAVIGAGTGNRVEIVSVDEINGRLLVRYRSTAGRPIASAEDPAAYHVIVVPSSKLPPVFEQVP